MEDQTLTSPTASSADSSNNSSNANADSGHQAPASTHDHGYDANSSAQSSNAGQEGAKEPKTLLDAVKSAIKKPSEGKSPAPQQNSIPPKEEGNAPADEKDKAELGKPDSEEDKRFDQHPRFQKLLRENKQFKVEAEKLTADATNFRELTGFIQQNQITPKEYSEGLEIMALMKHNVPLAFQKLKVHFENLQTFLGQILPADLQQQLDQGAITPKYAQEIAHQRNQLAWNQQRTTEQQRASAQQQQFNSQQAHLNALNEAGRVFVAGVQARDPDYAAKSKWFERAIKVAEITNPPRNAQEATALCQKTWDEVTQELTAFAPQRVPVRTLPPSSSSAPVAPDPKDLLANVKHNLRKARR